MSYLDHQNIQMNKNQDMLNTSGNMISTTLSEQQTSCSDDSFSSHRMSNIDISFPYDLIQVKNVKKSSLERKEKQRTSNKLRMKRQSSLVEIVTEEVRGEQEKIIQSKRRVFPHLKLIFDDGEKSEDSEILQQIQRQRCRSTDRLGMVIEEENDFLNQKILEYDDENNQEKCDCMKLSGFLHVENLIDKQEPYHDLPTPKKLNSMSKKIYQASQEDIIKEDYEKENIVNEEKIEFKSNSNSVFSSQTNSPKFRLKVDEIDDDFKKISLKKGYSEENSIILEEDEKENDKLNDLLEKVRQKIEKQESFLKKIAMINDEVDDDLYQSRGVNVEQIEEIENDCDEKNSSFEDDSPIRKCIMSISQKSNEFQYEDSPEKSKE